MILALDAGNTQIHGGVYGEEERALTQFRKNTKSSNSADELGLFLVTVLRESGIDPKKIERIAVCSVVPDLNHSLKGACSKYFGRNPFMLQAGTRTGLKIKYRNPLEVGSDRIANAIAATHLYPETNVVIADFGTATTYDVVNRDREYLGGLILPGMRISMEALESRTARLPAVEILSPEEIVGRSTVESIQSGLYYQNLFAHRGITDRIRKECFPGEEIVVLGTGGFSRMFEKEGGFDAIIPDLVLMGLKLALQMNL